MPGEPDVDSVAATTHGRMLVRRAASPRGILAGFHGYLENAAIQLARLESIPGAADWTLASIQGLHRVYRGRTDEVVAGWMTRQDRDEAITDNLAYVATALKTVAPDQSMLVVYAGFSQGGQMAFRAAVRNGSACGIISVGSDVPPELLADPPRAFPPVLLVRGERDARYTPAKYDADIAALTARGVPLTGLVHGGGHEWTAEVAAAAARWISALSLTNQPSGSSD